ncbi:unnamed protein product [Clonostachys byssicola]|uniref:Transmembrane protein n=1 Tax=Clonostachys byssicola TaxID=160290 RepID=A0A9N9Y3X6_9HYPO|nr:unnamed protein product [Clonostachys byssicola]
MYKSLYSYSLTRHYPYRWFTPVLVVGGVIAIAGFSILNVAAQGYELTPRSSVNPNETSSQRDWLSNWPTFLVGAHPSCEDTVIPLQAQIYTNKSAIPYTIESVWKIADGEQIENLGSLVYHNQPLQQCNISSIVSDFDIQARSASQMAMLPVGGTVTTTAVCYFGSKEGRTYVQLNGLFDPVGPSYRNYRSFIYSNQSYQANLYWGHSMMRTYWADMMWKFAESNKKRGNRWYNGVVFVDLLPEKQIATEQDIMDKDFLRLDCFLNMRQDPDTRTFIEFCDSRKNMTMLAELGGDDVPDLDFWESINNLSKATYFTVLADLGRDDASMPNILSRPSLLKDFTQGLAFTRENLGTAFTWGLHDIGTKSFDPSEFPSVDLAIEPAVLSTTYLCKVRVLKNPANLIMAVLVADIVFVSALWRLYKWVVDTFWVGEAATLPQCACYKPEEVKNGEVTDEEQIPLQSIQSGFTSKDGPSVGDIAGKSRSTEQIANRSGSEA